MTIGEQRPVDTTDVNQSTAVSTHKLEHLSRWLGMRLGMHSHMDAIRRLQ